jgi:hypothetical protein
MSLKSLKPVIDYIRSENSADMALHTSAAMDVRLKELEIMCRSLFLTPRNDDYLSLIIADRK